MSNHYALGIGSMPAAQKSAGEAQGYALSKEDQAWLDGVYKKLLVKKNAQCGRIGTMIPETTYGGGKAYVLGQQSGLCK